MLKQFFKKKMIGLFLCNSYKTTVHVQQSCLNGDGLKGNSHSEKS